MKNDVVYILKEGIQPEELRFSLRSVEKNFPHRKVWFVGAQPDGFFPDGRIRHKQDGITKWERVCSSLRQIIRCEDISEKFFLFNDDFFVLKPIDTDNFKNMVGGTLERRIREIRINAGDSSYSRRLNELRNELLNRECDSLSFALHVPFLVDKAKCNEPLRLNSTMFRSAYGNINKEPFEYHEDVKIYDNEKKPKPEWEYLSTTENSFASGEVGKIIRGLFPEISRFEKPKEIKKVKELYTEEGDSLYG